MRSDTVVNVGPGSFTGAANQHCHPSGESPSQIHPATPGTKGATRWLGLLSGVGPPPYPRASAPAAFGMAGSRARVTLALTMTVLTDSWLGLPSTSTCRQSDKVSFTFLASTLLDAV